ncbi:MAG: type IV toxin-antitoxin system AbiEi family antitoxin domain-containing protein [Acidimicrobiales bacterium]|nr:type IV toxin-antitoxin system AbiEi family antitoxin domain-containing protein [Acidimicrobiales bacterium]
MSTLPHALIELAESRHGVITRAAIDAEGISRRRLDRLVSQRILERVGRRVYRVSGAPRTLRQRILIACLDARGVATHRTAAALHGLNGFTEDLQPEVMIHEARNCRSKLARLRTTSTIEPVDITEVDGIPTTTVARTLLSLASIAGPASKGKEIRDWVVEDAFDEALASGRVTAEELEETLQRCRQSGRGGVKVIERLLQERSSGQVTESHLERVALRVLADAGVRLPECQERIAPEGEFVARVDFIYPGSRSVIEVSGQRWHRTAAQMERDTERRRRLTFLGYRVFEFTYREVTRKPWLLVRTARGILDGRATGESATSAA